MTDWKQLARDHEASADHYAREYEKMRVANTELLEVLERHTKMFDMVCGKINFGDAFLDAETIAEWNEASVQAAKAIRKHKGD